jgi:hypothetical protein
MKLYFRIQQALTSVISLQAVLLLLMMRTIFHAKGKTSALVVKTVQVPQNQVSIGVHIILNYSSCIS